MFRRYYMAFKQYKEIRYEGIHQSHEGAFRSQPREARQDASDDAEIRELFRRSAGLCREDLCRPRE